MWSLPKLNKRINLQIDNLRPSQSLIQKPYCFFSCMAVPPLHGCPRGICGSPGGYYGRAFVLQRQGNQAMSRGDH